MLNDKSALRKDRKSAGNFCDMQHRHFAFVAGIIASFARDGGIVGDCDFRDNVAELFADAFAKTNTRFDRARFLRACKNG